MKFRKDGIGFRNRISSLAHIFALNLILHCAPYGHAENNARAALAAPRGALTNAVTRGDAAALAKIFTTDARLMVPGFETAIGREAIRKFWQAGFSVGIIKSAAFATADVTGEDNGLLAETGTLVTIGGDGKTKNESRYLIVWKREEGEWRIHRDIVNSELPPAPTVDRVGFPTDYRTSFKVLGVPTRTNTSPSMVLTAYGNELAASVTNAEQLPYPNGSVMVMEFANALTDSDGKPVLDAHGQRQKGEVQHIDVMRRDAGFGEGYGSNRSGEWEFAGYYLDGTYSTPPAKTASCAQCHQKIGAARDFVFPLRAAK